MKRQPKPPADEGNVLRVKTASGRLDPQTMGQLVMGGMAGNAATARVFSKGLLGESDLTECFEAIQDSAARVNRGDLAGLESVLVAQSVALDKIFNELARRAAQNMGEFLDATDRYMRLALKAQSQCRATVETLATIKNPPVVFAKQANIANGPQQINNGSAPIAAQVRAPVRAENSDSLKSELLACGLNATQAAGLDLATGRIPDDGRQ